MRYGAGFSGDPEICWLSGQPWYPSSMPATRRIFVESVDAETS